MEEQENFTIAGTPNNLLIMDKEKYILETEIFKTVLDQFYLNNFYPKARYENGRIVDVQIFLA